TPGRIRSSLDEGYVAIVAGFQGVSQTAKNITTLGRGGSDTTAVALAASLDADVCEIYTDVDGVFTADPRIVDSARKIDEIGYEEMMEMAASGAKVLMLRCVEYARRYNVPVHVRSSFSRNQGTWVTDSPIPDAFRQGRGKSTPAAAESETESTVEPALISGVAHDRPDRRTPASGAKVLMLRCVEYARRYNVPVHVRSSFSRNQGTWVTDSPIPEAFRQGRGKSTPAAAESETESTMEQAIISGVAHDR